MLYASDIIGKQVISLYESEYVGTVCNLFLNKKRTKVSCIEIINKADEKQYLKTDDIFEVGQVVVIKSTLKLINEYEFDNQTITTSLINTNVFSEKGNYFGRVIDLSFDHLLHLNNLIVSKPTDLNNEYENLIFEKDQSKKESILRDTLITTMNLNDIIRVGEILIIKEGENKINFNSLKPRIVLKPEYSKQKVYALNEEITEPEISNIENAGGEIWYQQEKIVDESSQNFKKKTKALKSNITPVSVMSNSYDFLLGRKPDRNILASNKEIIIRKGTKITEKHIEVATTYNKLRELAIFSKWYKVSLTTYFTHYAVVCKKTTNSYWYHISLKSHVHQHGFFVLIIYYLDSKFKYPLGSTFEPSFQTSKWRCAPSFSSTPVAVETVPIWSPVETASPTSTKVVSSSML